MAAAVRPRYGPPMSERRGAEPCASEWVRFVLVARGPAASGAFERAASSLPEASRWPALELEPATTARERLAALERWLGGRVRSGSRAAHVIALEPALVRGLAGALLGLPPERLEVDPGAALVVDWPIDPAEEPRCGSLGTSAWPAPPPSSGSDDGRASFPTGPAARPEPTES